MNILLLQLDGKLPNLALMRLAAHHRRYGHGVELRKAGNAAALEPRFNDPPWDRVYASAIFERTRGLAHRVNHVYPGISTIGGTGVDMVTTLEGLGIHDGPDYRDYPDFRASMGYTQRGCRLKCGFCVVPKKEGAVRPAATIAEIWRGDPHPRWVLLLDNDFFGNPQWQARIGELADGRFRVSFNQGINARMLTDETAAAIASVDYRDDSMQRKRLYTAWDNKKDERRLFAGLEALVHRGVKPDHIMVYMLIGYWPGETFEDIDHRRRQLRAFGARPYPMPFRRTPELVGFQRWVVGAYDKTFSWKEWSAARFEPRNLQRTNRSLPLFDDEDAPGAVSDVDLEPFS